MKVLFVQPSHLMRDGKVFRSARLPYPSLALPLIAALTPKDFDCEIVNDYYEDIDYDAPCDVVAITAMTPQVVRGYQIAEGFRARGKHVVMGGFHVTMLPDEAKQYCDTIICGEAENTWPEFIDDFRAGKPREVYKSKGLVDIATLPTPRYDLLNRKGYSLRVWPVQTTRGCPRQCDFCSVSQFYGGSYRFRPIEHVVRDIHATRSRFISFIDDNIAANKRYCRDLCAAIKPLKLVWGSQCNLNVAKDKELLRQMSEAGCVGLFLGVESVNAASLASVNKEFNKIEEYSGDLQAIRDAGIMPMASMIVGLDGDDERVFQATYDFLIKNRVPVAYIFILTPGPGTRLFERLEKEGRLLHKDWSRYGGDEVVFAPKLMSPETLEKGFWEVLRRFYSLPGVFRRVIGSMPLSRRMIYNLKYNMIHHRSLKRNTHPLRG